MDFLDITDKTFLVFGVANKKSVAYAVSDVLTGAGAKVVQVVQNEEIKGRVSKLFPGTDIFICDVEHENAIEKLTEEISKKYTRFNGIVHSIAFANYEEGLKPFHETKRKDFLQAVNISCYSLIGIASAFRDMLDNNASVVTISISSTKLAAEPYGYMSPIKAALDSTVCLLAKSFSQFSQVRFNSVNSGPLKTSASAGIPGFIDYFLYVEKMTLRGKAVDTVEVANTVAFLLSERSSGINAQGVVVDAGMSVNYFDKNIIDKAIRD